MLPKSANRPVTPEDLKIEVTPAHIGTEVVMDGQIMGENLVRLGRDEEWLEKELRAQGCKRAGDVFLGIYNSAEDRLTVFPVE